MSKDELVIRMIKHPTGVYLHKDDVIDLLKGAFQKAETLNAKAAIKCIANDLICGEDIDLEGEETCDLDDLRVQ